MNNLSNFFVLSVGDDGKKYEVYCSAHAPEGAKQISVQQAVGLDAKCDHLGCTEEI